MDVLFLVLKLMYNLPRPEWFVKHKTVIKH